MIWSSFGVSFVSKSLGKTAWSVVMVVRPKISIPLKGWYGTWIEILSNALRKVRVYFEPMLNPHFTRANPNFWDKYIVFFQTQCFSNAWWTRAKPVLYLYPCKPVLFVRALRGPTFAIFAPIFKNIDHNMKINVGIGIIGGWCWLSMLSSG